MMEAEAVAEDVTVTDGTTLDDAEADGMPDGLTEGVVLGVCDSVTEVEVE